QVARIRALPDVAIDETADAGVGKVDLVAGHGPWPHRAERVLRFRDQPLAMARLQVAGGDVVDDGVAPDMLHGLFPADCPPRLADDDGEFRLVVDRCRYGR